MKKTAFATFCLALVLTFTACVQSGDIFTEISSTLAQDVSGAQLAYQNDSHGGFHGDGTSIYTLVFPDNSFEMAIADSEQWYELPLAQELTILLYGVTDAHGSYGPYITLDGDTFSDIAKIENGRWFFLDRHSAASHSGELGEIFDRASFNLTIAVYDFDTKTLYYIKYDT